MKFDNLEAIVSEIKSAQLPGVEAQKAFLSIEMRNRLSAMKQDSNPKLSGVAAMLFPDFSGNANIILIERQSYKGVHSGQIAFPGGKKDPNDSSLEFTARREALEEVGVPINEGELISELTEVYIPPSGYIVKPFVFLLSKEPTLVGNDREVKSIISFKVGDLLNEQTLKLGSVGIQGGKILNTPYFDAQGHRVWGATALILNELKLLLKNTSLV